MDYETQRDYEMWMDRVRQECNADIKAYIEGTDWSQYVDYVEFRPPSPSYEILTIDDIELTIDDIEFDTHDLE